MGRDIRPIQPTRYKKLGEGKLTPISDKSPIIIKVKMPFSVQFIVKDANGKILTDTYYSISIAGDKVKHGVTDKEGKTERYSTFKAQKVEFYFGHLDDKGTTEKPIDGETINDKTTVTPIQTQRIGKPWTITQKGRDFIKREEAAKNHIYLDDKGLPTIGIGHLITPEENANHTFIHGLTDQQVIDLFEKKDLPIYIAQLRHIKVPLHQREIDALVALGFNAPAALKPSNNITKLLNAGKYTKVPEIILQYSHETKKDKFKRKIFVLSKGLLRRRKEEVQIYLNADYSYIKE